MIGIEINEKLRNCEEKNTRRDKSIKVVILNIKIMKKLEISSSEIARQFCIDNNIELPKGSEKALEYGKNFENVISTALHLSYKYGYIGNLKEYIESRKDILIKGMLHMMDFNDIVVDTEIKLDDYDKRYNYLDSLTFKELEALAGENLLDYFIKGIQVKYFSERYYKKLFVTIKNFDDKQRKMFEFLFDYEMFGTPPTRHNEYIYEYDGDELNVSIYYKPDLYKKTNMFGTIFLEFKSSFVSTYEKIQAAVFRIVSESKVILVGFDEKDNVREFDYSEWINNVHDYIKEGSYIESFKDRIKDKEEDFDELPF